MFVRILVAAAVLSWPSVEAYRLYVARQQLSAARELHRSVKVREAAVRANAARLAQGSQAMAQQPVNDQGSAK